MSDLSRPKLHAEYRELRDLLCAWDPIGVMDDPDWPRDEYDCLVAPVLRRLDAGESPESLAAFLETEVRAYFGVEPVTDAARTFAERAEAWYRQRRFGAGPATSST